MKTALVAVAKDEDNYIEEWIDFHLKVGFTDIFIYGDEWELPPHLLTNEHIHFEYVERKNKDALIKNPQVTVYMKFCREHWQEYDWAAFFDIDEFLTLVKWKTLDEMLDEYKDYPSLYVNWLLFGSNGLKTIENNDYSVVRRFTKSGSWFQRIGKSIHNFKIMKNEFLPHVHVIQQNDKFNTRDLLGNEVIDKLSNANDLSELGNLAYLAHYRVKSYQEFEEKVKRNIDGYGDKDWTIHLNDFNSHDKNNIENTDVIEFFNR